MAHHPPGIGQRIARVTLPSSSSAFPARSATHRATAGEYLIFTSSLAWPRKTRPSRTTSSSENPSGSSNFSSLSDGALDAVEAEDPEGPLFSQCATRYQAPDANTQA